MYNQGGSLNNLQMFQTYSVNEVRSIYRQARLKPRTGDELEMDVPLQIQSSKGALWVSVILPAKYPYQCPIISILKAKVVHQFIDDHLRVTHPLLTNWTQKSSLLEIIKQVHNEFNKQPPKLAAKAAAKQQQQEAKKGGTLIQKPDINKIYKQLEQLGEEEMQTLVDDDDFFNDYFINLDGVKELGTNFSKIMDSLKSQAEENLQGKENVDNEIQAHEELYERYEAISEQFEDLKAKEQSIMKNLSKANITSAINEKIAQGENEDKKILKNFKSGDLDIEDYVEQYRKNHEELAKYKIILKKVS